MHVTIPRSALLGLLESVIGSAAKKHPAADVTGTTEAVKLTASTGGIGEAPTLHVVATDLTQATSGTIPAEVHEHGALCLHAHKLLDRVRAMPVGPVLIESGEDGRRGFVRAVGHPRWFAMPSFPAAAFPSIHESPPDASWSTLDASVLGRLLDASVYAVSSDVTRAHINSLYLEWQGTVLRTYATDGHRLARVMVDVPERHAGLLIPADAIAQIRRLVDGLKDGAKVQLAHAGPHLFLDLDGIRFATRMTDATFPSCSEVITGAQCGTSGRVVADRNKLLEVIRAACVSSSHALLIDVVATKSGGRIIVGNVGEDRDERGESHDELAVTGDCKPVVVGMNGKYIVQALEAMPEGDVVLRFGGEVDAVVVEPATKGEGEERLGVMMPVRVGAATKAGEAA
jgi:DNA polymerase III subunit beta